MTSRARLFIDALTAEQRARIHGEEALHRQVDGVFAASRAAWPSFEVPPEVFLPFLASKVGADASPADSLASLRVADLYLACACAEGDPSAIAAFEAEHAAGIRAVLRKRGLAPETVEDAAQQLKGKLFVAEPGAGPRIREFGGRAQLASWLRVAAVRTALHGIEKENKHAGDEDAKIADMAASRSDPELELMRKKYTAEFKSALVEALAGLDTREVNLLRQHFVDGLAMEAIGRLYDVHRITVVRWIGQARAKLVERTRAAFVARVGGIEADADSLLRLIHSQLDLSLRGLLAGDVRR